MNTTPLLLIAAALADWFISLQPFKTIAGRFNLEPEQLEKDLPPLTQPHTFRGQLEAALAAPNVRPDLIPQRIHLARLEEQLTFLLKQRDRAEECVNRFRSHPEGDPREDRGDAELMKAEIFANRVQQQCIKLIKDIDKDRKALQKAAAEPAPDLNPTPNVAPHRMTNNQSPMTMDSELLANDQIPMTTAHSPPPPPFNPLTAGAVEIPLTPAATTDEYLNCLVENRHRLKNTPAQDRQKLIARLIEEHRIKEDRGRTTTRAA